MKFILTTLLALMSVVANAQKLEGMYNADKEFEEMANEYVGKVIEQKNIQLGLDIKVGLSLFFNGDNIDLILAQNTRDCNIALARVKGDFNGIISETFIKRLILAAKAEINALDDAGFTGI